MNPSDEGTEAPGVDPAGIADALLIDVRRVAAFGQSRHMLPGAQWRDPEAILAWSGTLATGRAIVVYCVHGHEVSRNAARHLRAQGFDAGFLRGGFDAWKDAGLPLVDKPQAGED